SNMNYDTYYIYEHFVTNKFGNINCLLQIMNIKKGLLTSFWFSIFNLNNENRKPKRGKNYKTKQIIFICVFFTLDVAKFICYKNVHISDGVNLRMDSIAVIAAANIIIHIGLNL
ncbi:hypothetical protein ACJX0J_012908, partial [Zea mays]